MRKLITLLLMAISMSTLIKAQDFDFYISDPDPVPEPLEFCMGETVTFTLDYLGWGWSDWLICSEAPDLEGYSNFNLWEPVYPTDNSYTLTVSSEVYFWVKVSEDFTSSNSEVFHIQLKGDIPEIIYTDTEFCGGTTLNISCSIDNLGDGKYQWYKDNLLIEGETNAALEISEGGSYFVSALTNETDCPGIYYSSAPVQFYYTKPELEGIFKPDLGRVTLATTLEYDNYQWLQASNTTIDMVEISGANSSNYNATITSEDIYYGIEIITNSGCIAQSDRFLINDSLYSNPEIIEPSETFVCRDVIISLELSNQAYSSYQWYKDGSLIWGATSASFEAGANYPGGTGSYNVKVTTELDPNTEFESNTIELTFADQPNISIKDDALLCPGGTVTLEAKPGWNGEVGGYDTYQWYFNDVNDISAAVEISGATDSVIEIDVPAETRYYWVKTSLNGCEDESYAKTIQEFELYAPYISMNPWGGFICLGDTVTLKVYTNDVTYQWYYNGEIIEGATEQEYKATMVGYYDIEIASTLCESAAPIMNNDSAVIDYRVKPTYTVDPAGEEYNNNPNHRIFCKGDTVNLMVANPTNYNNYQWYGKLFPIYSTTDEWEPITDATQANYGFINGVDNDKLHYKIRVDSIMDNDEVCAGFSDYKTIDGWVFQDPVVASYDNSELCDEGDSTMLHIAYPGEWAKFEWYVDGVLAEGFDNDTAWANYPGMWVVAAYPEKCPSHQHNSGTGPTVQMMPEAFIAKDEYALFANPYGAYGRVYEYVWYLDGELIDTTTMGLDEHPGYILIEDVIPGMYEAVVTNPEGCTRYSEPYVVVGTDDKLSISTRIYPNPVNNELNISLDDISNVTSIEIYSSTGILVDKLNAIHNSNSIQMEKQKGGIYLIKINYTDMSSNTYKVVKN